MVPGVTSRPDWTAPDLDLSKASAARMYDYFLGGAHNFAVDRELAQQVLAMIPDMELNVQANRMFLGRAVRYLLSQGVRQFIDIGSGIPTRGNVHEITQGETPPSRVLYVDHDPVAVTHSELILGDNPDVKVLQADARHPGAVLDSSLRAGLIDLDRPVGLLMVAVLHFIPDADRPEAIVRAFRERLAPGSHLVISHANGEARAQAAEGVADLYRSDADDALTLRSRKQIGELFEGWELVEPGVVWVPEWRPDWPDEVGSHPEASTVAVAVGRKN
jgi:SAM-dependent methyltransferase